MIGTWSEITLNSLQNLWQGFLVFIPKLIGGLIVFIVGWFIAVWIGKLVAEILKRLRLDRVFEKSKWEGAMTKADFKMKMSEFIGAVVKWVLVIVFLLAAVEIWGMTQFASFLQAIVNWLPNVVVAAAIFVVAVIVGDFAGKLVEAVVGKMGIGYVKLVGGIVKGSIWVFAILTILSQLGVASRIIEIVVTGFVALIVVSGALAFGLGGKDLAKEILQNLRRKVER